MNKIYKEWYDSKGRKHTLLLEGDVITQTVEESGHQRRSKDGKGDPWYKRPAGILILSVASGVVVLGIGVALRHYFPELFVPH